MAQAKTDYEGAIADLNAARSMTRCQHRIKNIDSGLSKVKDGLARVNGMMAARAGGGTAKPPPSPVDGTKDWRDRWAGTWKGKGQQKLKGPKEGQTVPCTITLKIQPGACKGNICTLSVQMQASPPSFPAENSYALEVDITKPARAARSWTKQGGRPDKDGRSLLASHAVEFSLGDNKLTGVYSYSDDITSFRAAGASLEFKTDRMSR